MTEPTPQLNVNTHNGQHTLDLICDIDTDTDNLHDRDQSHQYGFNYDIDFMADSLEEIRAKSHLCRLLGDGTDD